MLQRLQGVAIGLPGSLRQTQLPDGASPLSASRTEDLLEHVAGVVFAAGEVQRKARQRRGLRVIQARQIRPAGYALPRCRARQGDLSI